MAQTLAHLPARLFALDPRALVAFRVALALTVLADVAGRALALDLIAPDGPIPASLVQPAWLASALAWSASTHALTMVLVMESVAALLILAGRSERTVRAGLAGALAIAVFWHARAPLLSFGGDDLLRSLLLFALFVPLANAQWHASTRVTGPAALALALHPLLVLAGGALVKLQDAAWRGGDVLAHVAASFNRTPLIDVFVPFDPWLTWLTLALELTAPILLLVADARVRMAGFLAVIALQLGLALAMDVGTFPLVTIACALPLLRREGEAPIAPAPTGAPRMLALALLACVVFTNVDSIVARAQHAHPVMRALGVDHRWGMFARPRALPHGWLTAWAETGAGAAYEVFSDRDRAAVEAAPKEGALAYDVARNFRERRFLEYLAYPHAAPYLDAVGAWLCRRATLARPGVRAVVLELNDEQRAPQGARALALEITRHECTATR